MGWSVSRRDFLGLAAIGAISPPELKRYPDPATELQVIRLTDPAFVSGLTAPHLRQFTRHGEYLLAWSERTGTRQAFLTNLKSGEFLELTDAKALDPATLSISADEKSFFYFDGAGLFESPLLKPAPREIYRIPEGAVRTGFTAAGDGVLFIVETMGEKTRVMRIAPRQSPRKAFDVDGAIDGVMARPGNLRTRLHVVYRQQGALWVSGADGGARRALKTEPGGKTGEALWIPSGRTLIYLHIPAGARELITLREHNPDTGGDTLIAKTTQYISASPNADASVFVAASGSVASPYILILVRSVGRELTLCEHRASDASMVNPAFTPDSRNVLFVSDRHGKPAIYMMPVARFVEDTSADEEPAKRG